MFVVLAVATAGRAAESAPSLLPQSTVLYVEIPQPRAILATILEHPLRTRMEALDGYQRSLRTKEFRQLKAVVAMVEAELDADWHEIVSTIAAGGLYAAVDGQTEGVALLAKSDNQELLQKARDTLLTLIRGDAQLKGKSDPVKTVEYRGIQAFEASQTKFATFGPWLLVTNKGELGQRIIDCHLDGSNDTLADNERFLAARQPDANQSTAWAFADVQAIRDAGAAPKLFQGQTDNPVAELIVGGLLSNIQKTPLVAATLDVKPNRLHLNLSAPHDPAWIGEPREYYFGPHGEGAAPSLLQPSEALLTLSTYRDLAGMWLHAGDLFDEGVNDSLAQADSGLSTLFSGKDFGEEILGALEPQIQVVVTRQDFAEMLPQPAIRLPSFAVVFRLKEADEMRDELRRTFQSLLGFLNVAGASKGQPQLDFQVEKQGTTSLVTSNYVPEQDEQQSRQARINFNFSPSVALRAGSIHHLQRGRPGPPAERSTSGGFRRATCQHNRSAECRCVARGPGRQSRPASRPEHAGRRAQQTRSRGADRYLAGHRRLVSRGIAASRQS